MELLPSLIYVIVKPDGAASRPVARALRYIRSKGKVGEYGESQKGEHLFSHLMVQVTNLVD